MRYILCLAGLLLAAGCATSPNLTAFDVSSSADHPSAGGSVDAAPGRGAVDMPTTGALTFEGLWALLEQQNPELRAARETVNAERGRTMQSSLLPNPVGEFEIEDYGLGGGSGSNDAEETLRVRQPFRWPSERRSAVRAGQAEIEVARNRVNRLRLELLAQLAGVYVDAQYYGRALKLNDELSSLTRQSLSIAQTRFGLKASPQSDVSRAEVEVFDLALSRRELERNQRKAFNRLTQLLGGLQIQLLHLETDAALPDESFASDELTDWVMRHHPTLTIARAEYDAARHRLRHAEKERLPDLYASAGFSHSNAGSDNALEAAIGIEIPLFDRNQGRIRERESQVRQSRLVIQAEEDRLAAELRSALEDRESALERQAYHARYVLPSAQGAFEQVRAGYEAGKLGFLELIDAQRTLTAAQLQQHALTHEIQQTRVRLLGLAGPRLAPQLIEFTNHDSEGETP